MTILDRNLTGLGERGRNRTRLTRAAEQGQRAQADRSQTVPDRFPERAQSEGSGLKLEVEFAQEEKFVTYTEIGIPPIEVLKDRSLPSNGCVRSVGHLFNSLIQFTRL